MEDMNHHKKRPKKKKKNGNLETLWSAEVAVTEKKTVVFPGEP